ncbi:hypothetical protein BDY19DRAFT_934064 [Irpex rosettiformis]|uniref:Uncharacterized protein n=1 Tax=Irpex rosettiformis TaxID=378272 RepID=A0ACB8UA80_9APHY|nr:hypothetical protein BDY19DRAFT_934064 [Irpex rosettiformis]
MGSQNSAYNLRNPSSGTFFVDGGAGTRCARPYSGRPLDQGLSPWHYIMPTHPLDVSSRTYDDSHPHGASRTLPQGITRPANLFDYSTRHRNAAPADTPSSYVLSVHQPRLPYDTGISAFPDNSIPQSNNTPLSSNAYARHMRNTMSSPTRTLIPAPRRSQPSRFSPYGRSTGRRISQEGLRPNQVYQSQAQLGQGCLATPEGTSCGVNLEGLFPYSFASGPTGMESERITVPGSDFAVANTADCTAREGKQYQQCVQPFYCGSSGGIHDAAFKEDLAAFTSYSQNIPDNTFRWFDTNFPQDPELSSDPQFDQGVSSEDPSQVIAQSCPDMGVDSDNGYLVGLMPSALGSAGLLHEDWSYGGVQDLSPTIIPPASSGNLDVSSTLGDISTGTSSGTQLVSSTVTRAFGSANPSSASMQGDYHAVHPDGWQDSLAVLEGALPNERHSSVNRTHKANDMFANLRFHAPGSTGVPFDSQIAELDFRFASTDISLSLPAEGYHVNTAGHSMSLAALSTSSTIVEPTAEDDHSSRCYPCTDPRCSDKFRRKNDVRRHVKYVHNNRAAGACMRSGCRGRSFARPDAFKRHIQGSPRNPTPTACMNYYQKEAERLFDGDRSRWWDAAKKLTEARKQEGY